MALYSETSPLADIMPGLKKIGSKINKAYQQHGENRVQRYGGSGENSLPQAPVAPAIEAQAPAAPAIEAQAPAAPAIEAQAPAAPAIEAQVPTAPAIEAQAPAAPAIEAQAPQTVNYPTGQGEQMLPGGQLGQTSFDNDYVNRTYGNLNNREVNQERFDRNMQDALKQDQASQAMVNRINRGTKAMAELRQMRSGVADGQGPALSGFNQAPGMKGAGINSAGFSTQDALPAAPTQRPGDVLAEKKFQFDQQKYQEGKEISAKDKQLAWDKYKADPKNTFNEMIMDKNLTLALDDIRKSGNDPARISAFNNNFQLPYETVMQLFQQYGKSDSLLPMG